MLTYFITIHEFLHDYIRRCWKVFNNNTSQEDLLLMIKSAILANLTIEI